MLLGSMVSSKPETSLKDPLHRRSPERLSCRLTRKRKGTNSVIFQLSLPFAESVGERKANPVDGQRGGQYDFDEDHSLLALYLLYVKRLFREPASKCTLTMQLAQKVFQSQPGSRITVVSAKHQAFAQLF